VLPALSRLGVGRVLYATAYGGLPAQARDEARAFWATPRGARSTRDEFSQIRKTMAEAHLLTTLGGRPLIVVTAVKGAEGGWVAEQDKLAALSTNSAHLMLPNATHNMVVEDEGTARRSSEAVLDVVNAVRTGTPVTGQGG